MTPIEHGILAYNLGALVRGRSRDAAFSVAVVAAGLAPDIDGLTLAFGRDAYVRYHRTVAHSLLGAVLVGAAAAALALLAWRTVKGRSQDLGAPRIGLSWRWLCLAAALGGISHVAIDAIYPWPIPLLWPFSTAKDCFPLFPWGDRVILVIMLASMFGQAGWRSRPRTVACVTLLALAIYGVVRWRVPIV